MKNGDFGVILLYRKMIFGERQVTTSHRKEDGMGITRFANEKKAILPKIFVSSFTWLNDNQIVIIARGMSDGQDRRVLDTLPGLLIGIYTYFAPPP
jgi:hypothetical protein